MQELEFPVDETDEGGTGKCRSERFLLMKPMRAGQVNAGVIVWSQLS